MSIATHVGHHGSLQIEPRLEGHLIVWYDAQELLGSSMPLETIPRVVSPLMPPPRLEVEWPTYAEIAQTGATPGTKESLVPTPEPGAFAMLCVLLVAIVIWERCAKAIAGRMR